MRDLLPGEDYLARHFERLLGRLGAAGDPLVLLAARLTALATAAGHTCLDLRQHAAGSPDAPVAAPDLAAWRSALRASGVVGAPGAYRPLILDHQDRLYLMRYREYEDRLADHLLERAEGVVPAVNGPRLRASLQRLFPPDATGQGDGPRLAAAVAAMKRFTVIAGGPGTGKTTAVVKILALLLEQDPGLRIGVAAPTGKAAARVSEAVRSARSQLDSRPEVVAAIPDGAATLHRLLGWLPGASGFRHRAANPLALDVLVVDEASMVGIALAWRLLDALPTGARLILLGDRDQLASVEAGAVLGDICAGAGPMPETFARRLESLCGLEIPVALRTREKVSPLAECVVTLTYSHRYKGDGGIAALASAMRDGVTTQVAQLLRDAPQGEISLIEPDGEETVPRSLPSSATRGLQPYFTALETSSDPGELAQVFDGFRLLTAHREGVRGVRGLNSMVEEHLRHRNQIVPGRTWYRGRPVMVTRNEYAMHLFNGDVGITLFDPVDDGRLVVAFPGRDGPRLHGTARIPAHETVYAMTVHKSQGSEFDRVVFVLPAKPTPVLTRELVYTAVTRARHHVEIHGALDVFLAAVNRTEQRRSGLRDRLWPGQLRLLI